MFDIGRLGLYRELDERCSLRQDLTIHSVILEIKDVLDKLDIGQ